MVCLFLIFFFKEVVINWSQENLNQLPHRVVQHGSREATRTARSSLFSFTEEIALGLGEVNE